MRRSKTFPEMHKIVPEGRSGSVRVEHFTVSESASRLTAFDGGRAYVPAGRYARLLMSPGANSCMMSDTRFEHFTNYAVVNEAHGDVLIAGLGLGMILHPIAKKPEVRRVTVIEQSPDVIKLVGPTVPKRKVKVLEGDIFAWRPPRGTRFNTIYFDIWPSVTADNLEEMRQLHLAFKPYLARPAQDPERWMQSWQRDYLLGERRRERQNDGGLWHHVMGKLHNG